MDVKINSSQLDYIIQSLLNKAPFYYDYQFWIGAATLALSLAAVLYTAKYVRISRLSLVHLQKTFVENTVSLQKNNDLRAQLLKQGRLIEVSTQWNSLEALRSEQKSPAFTTSWHELLSV